MNNLDFDIFKIQIYSGLWNFVLFNFFYQTPFFVKLLNNQTSNK